MNLKAGRFEGLRRVYFALQILTSELAALALPKHQEAFAVPKNRCIRLRIPESGRDPLKDVLRSRFRRRQERSPRIPSTLHERSAFHRGIELKSCTF